MKVFGLELKQEYADLFISAMTVYSPDRLTRALADCSPQDIIELERILNEYYQFTEPLRVSGTSNSYKEAKASFFSAAAAPVVTLLAPLLEMKGIDLPRSITLAQLAYPDRRFPGDISIARGYMVERLITQGNKWERSNSDYHWLGENYREIATVATELEVRGSVERPLIMEMLRSTSAMISGAL